MIFCKFHKVWVKCRGDSNKLFFSFYFTYFLLFFFFYLIESLLNYLPTFCWNFENFCFISEKKNLKIVHLFQHFITFFIDMKMKKKFQQKTSPLVVYKKYQLEVNLITWFFFRFIIFFKCKKWFFEILAHIFFSVSSLSCYLYLFHWHGIFTYD